MAVTLATPLDCETAVVDERYPDAPLEPGFTVNVTVVPGTGEFVPFCVNMTASGSLKLEPPFVDCGVLPAMTDHE